MDNLTTSISFSIYSNKGIYSLLLGSGISKSAGIPTGWDILLDLIIRLAKIKKEEIKTDPESWYKTKYKEDPDYSNILDRLVPTSSERINVLKHYIEPNESEREQGLKIPTKAHYAIANLVKKGYIKVIITTNFDRLLENALQSVGIDPIVIKHANDIDGVIPLVHNDFVLVKVNGDYLDNRFLNTKSELSSYDEKMSNYLLQIINDFGLISCGWSGKWDNALVEVVNQCQNFRFGSFWSYKDNCEKELKEIAKKRKGKTIQILSADTFFLEILEKIEALETINDDHPINAEIALARLKKFIAKEEHKILLYDLLISELKSAKIKIDQFEDFGRYPDKILLTKYESSVKIIIDLIINGVYWSTTNHYETFKEMIIRISQPASDPSSRFYESSRSLHYYPAMMIFFSLGIAALKSKRYQLLAECFEIKVSESDYDGSNKNYLVQKVNSWMVDRQEMNKILDANLKTPLSSHINKILRPHFKELIPSSQDYNDYFDLFEYILGWYYLCFYNKVLGDWVPYGQYKWRSLSGLRKDNSIFHEFFFDADILKNGWAPIKEGLFNGYYEKYKEVKEKMDKYLNGFFL